jgi:tRNA uridine 5-carbamoylmethylation protein Kti12
MSKIIIFSGLPGVGKTTLVKHLQGLNSDNVPYVQ